jgi:hypothetical protein
MSNHLVKDMVTERKSACGKAAVVKMENTSGGDYWPTIQNRHMGSSFNGGAGAVIEHCTEFFRSWRPRLSSLTLYLRKMAKVLRI